MCDGCKMKVYDNEEDYGWVFRDLCIVHNESYHVTCERYDRRTKTTKLPVCVGAYQNDFCIDCECKKDCKTVRWMIEHNRYNCCHSEATVALLRKIYFTKFAPKMNKKERQEEMNRLLKLDEEKKALQISIEEIEISQNTIKKSLGGGLTKHKLTREYSDKGKY